MCFGVCRYLLSMVLCGFVLAGCRGDTPACEWDEGAQASICSLSDDHNFELDTVLSGEPVGLAPGEEATLSWAGATTDFLSRPVSSCEALQSVSIWLFPTLSPDEVLDGLAQEQLPAGSLGALWDCVPETCECGFADFSFVGHLFEPAVDFVVDRGTWLLMLSGGDLSGVRMLALFEPESAEANTTLSVSAEGVTGEATADWLDAEALVIDGEAAVLDWSALTVDGWGHALEDSIVDRLRIDRFEIQASELETQVGAWDTLSLEHWEATVSSETRIALADLEGAFPGVDGDSTWLLTLWCSTCRIALPRVAVLLEPVE